MKQLTINEALKLVGSQARPAISLYMGTEGGEADDPGSMKRKLQSLYRKAEELVAKTYGPETRERLLQTLQKSLKDLRLKSTHGGIAIYHSEEFSGMVQLPIAVSDLAVAAHSFHLKPVLRSSQMRRSYFLLAFRKKYVELLLVTADEATSLERFELRSRTDGPSIDDSAPKRLYKDGLKNRRQKDLRDRMYSLNRQLETYWVGDQRPLLLAGQKAHLDAFRASCHYGYLLPYGWVEVLDERDTRSILGHSEEIMQQYFASLEDLAVSSFRKAESWGLTSSHLRETAVAAVRGQIQSLFIAEDRHVWGQLNRETGALQVQDDQGDGAADDLLDDIAELVLMKHGRVTVLPSNRMPRGQSIAAILRWGDTQAPDRPSKTYPNHSAVVSSPSNFIISA